MNRTELGVALLTRRVSSPRIPRTPRRLAAFWPKPWAKRIQVHITIQSDEDQAEVVHGVACLERGPLGPDTLGLSLAEARAILERTMAEGQTAEFVAQAQRCPSCGQLRACKGHHPIVFRTPLR
jgi:hypothetical protein